MRSLYTCYPTEELAGWYKPKESDLSESIRSRFREACAALTAVLTGDMGITRAADAHGLCHKRLRAMVNAPRSWPTTGSRTGSGCVCRGVPINAAYRKAMRRCRAWPARMR